MDIADNPKHGSPFCVLSFLRAGCSRRLKQNLLQAVSGNACDDELESTPVHLETGAYRLSRSIAFGNNDSVYNVLTDSIQPNKQPLLRLSDIGHGQLQARADSGSSSGIDCILPDMIVAICLNAIDRRIRRTVEAGIYDTRADTTLLHNREGVAQGYRRCIEAFKLAKQGFGLNGFFRSDLIFNRRRDAFVPDAGMRLGHEGQQYQHWDD